MNENTKTLSFLGVAVAVCLVAWIARPQPYDIDLSSELGKKLNTGDPLDATSLEILEFDEQTGETKSFKVAKINDTWSLPSHLDYPADAENQLGEAAASVMDLLVLNVIQVTSDDFSTYDVVDPEQAKVGDSGVGKRVTLEKANGDKLAQVIIGKQVKDKPDQRYIRRPKQDVVYVVPLSTSKLSSKFEDWIEDDLLKLNSFDIRKVVLNKYSIDEVARQIVPDELLELSYDDQESKWSLVGLKPDEELETTKLNDMRSALDDLKIVNVQRTPASLSRALRGEERGLDPQAQISLVRHGFHIVDQALRSNEGEAFVTMKDGVEYTLRFGEIVFDTTGGFGDDEETEDEQGEPDEEPGDEEQPKGENRYIMVMARFDAEMIPEPELEPLPGEETGPEAESDAAEPSPSEGEPSPEGSEPSEQPQDDLDFAQADLATSEQETSSQQEFPTTQSEGQETEGEEPVGPEDIEAERERIERDNQRKREEYEKKVEEAQQKVKELNDRFSDWYYVISDEIYRKIRLNRAEIVKPKEEEGEGDAPSESDVPESSLQEFERLKESITPGAAPQ